MALNLKVLSIFNLDDSSVRCLRMPWRREIISVLLDEMQQISSSFSYHLSHQFDSICTLIHIRLRNINYASEVLAENTSFPRACLGFLSKFATLKHQVLVPLSIPQKCVHRPECSNQWKRLRARQEESMFKHKKPLFSQIYIFIKAKVYVILEETMKLMKIQKGTTLSSNRDWICSHTQGHERHCNIGQYWVQARH